MFSGIRGLSSIEERPLVFRPLVFTFSIDLIERYFPILKTQRNQIRREI